jgi:hypothetical protein
VRGAALLGAAIANIQLANIYLVQQAPVARQRGARDFTLRDTHAAQRPVIRDFLRPQVLTRRRSAWYSCAK